ncbi:MAG TPA: hypothetical protein VLY85_01520, partial [Thermoplasmata archaeon]|nr:hypothetical protein [Thermoplasmata archaeon]
MALRSTIDRSRGDSRRRRVALAVVSVVLVVSAAQTLASERTDRPALGPMGPEVPPRPASIGESAADPSAGPLNLSIRADPSAICSEESDLCPAGTGVAQVTLTATAPPPNPDGWSAAEVAFVIETTPYDGVYDPTEGGSVGDACAASGGPLCEESNGVPFFVTHAGAVAEAITAEHPTTEVSFALVDYFATWDGDDDGDGTSFHVDISQFVAASQFGPAVKSTFQAEQLDGGFVYPDSDLSDNFLDSSSISALYASLEGS